MSIQHNMSEIINSIEHSSSSLVNHINNKLANTSTSSPRYTIFKVDMLLRRENETAYEPNIVAIGPYHRGQDRLRVMEDQKLRWFKASLEKLGESDATKYVEAMKRLEPKARQCYSESTENMSEDEFVEMLLLDASFIIQFMRLCLFNSRVEADTFFTQGWVFINLKRDMLLFENQIPLFVVQELFSMIKLPQEPTYFHHLALGFLAQMWGAMFKKPDDTTWMQLFLSDVSHIQHILGLLQYTLSLADVNNNIAHVPSVNNVKWTTQLCETAAFKFISNQLCKLGCGWFDQQDRTNNHDRLKSESIPSAARLQAAGVKFRSKNVGGGPFDIKFENGVMEIPTLKIYDGTESLYRNLIAYEQYNQESDNRFVSRHAKLMDCLIDSSEDVAVLRMFGIVGSWLGEDEEVSGMFNKLVSQVCVGSDESKQHMTKLFEDVNAYYGKRRHTWMAKLRSDNFNSPWALISFLAAFFLLLLTLIQTIFSILN